MASEVVPICINDMAFLEMVPKKSIFSNQEEYINQLITFANNDKLREEYKVEIRKKAEEYSSKRYAERVLDVYRGVLTGGIKDNITKKEGIKDGKEKIIKECI